MTRNLATNLRPMTMPFARPRLASGPGATLILIVAALTLQQSVARAWDEDGHAIITHLAIDALPDSMPDWIRTPEVRDRLVYLSNEPDRWRGQRNSHLDHINNPDHYIDEEMLHPYGWSLKTLPPFRLQFTDLMAVKRAADPKKYAKGGIEDNRPDRDYTRPFPGFLPYRIAELQWQIAAGWTQLKTYEAHPDRVSESMLHNARENIVYSMGILSHYIGDGAQPLHLTIHHHGWLGENPNGYTTDSKFHAFIDDTIVTLHDITYDSLRSRAKPARKMSTKQYWRDINKYLYETYERVEPLYVLEKSGELKQDKGKRFIEERLLEGGAALAGAWVSAYEGARLDSFRVDRLKTRYPHEPGRRRSNAKQPGDEMENVEDIDGTESVESE